MRRQGVGVVAQAAEVDDLLQADVASGLSEGSGRVGVQAGEVGR